MEKNYKASNVEYWSNAAKATLSIVKRRVEAGTQSNNLIQVNCENACNTLTTLFDYGETYSFIAMDCVNYLKMAVFPLPFDLEVTTPAKALIGGGV